jgi:hypothetical protein
VDEILNEYKAPDIVYEGELEVQAGSPLGSPDWDEELDWDESGEDW